MRTLAQDRERKQREYWKTPIKHRADKLEWRKKNREKYMLYSARCRAKAKGWEFNLTPEDIVIPEVCPVFNVPFVHATGQGLQQYSPSLDRIDVTQGYVKGNVRVISWRANNLISNGSLQEFEQIVRFLNGS